jgi:hypothetical protein
MNLTPLCAVHTAPRKTRFRLLARLYRVGYLPLGPIERFQRRSLHLVPLSQPSPGAMTPILRDARATLERR